MRRLPSCPVPLAGVLSALLGAAPAAAQPNPPAAGPASYDVRTYRVDFRPEGAGSREVLVHTTPGTYATSNGLATVDVQTAPFTLLTAHATTDAGGVVTGASAQMFYSFRFLGAAETRVGATFTADLFGSAAGDIVDERTLAASAFRLYTLDPLAHFYDPDGAISVRTQGHSLRNSGGMAHFNTPVGFTVDANALYVVALELTAQTGSAGVVVDASLDPVITIDPAQRGAYQLVLSPGVSNLAPSVSVVPEPTTWTPVGAGLAGVAGVARRRRRTA